MTQPPDNVFIYHIVHMDKLASIMADGWLWSDAEVRLRRSPGTTVGMQDIKNRRLTIPLSSRPGLLVGQCVPFYFCPRSVMLYLLWRGNHEGVTYRGGQEPIVHLVSDLDEVVAWAEANNVRWAFTLSNAASSYFEDRADLGQLNEINWDAIEANQWSGNGISRSVKEGKQAEFLVERCFPWKLVSKIGVQSQKIGHEVTRLIAHNDHRPAIRVENRWYY